MKVYWSNQAKAEYLKTITYLLEKWTIEIATSLENNVNRLITNLEQHNHICPASIKKVNLRKCVISEHNSIIYYIENNQIHFVSFIHNKSNHSY